jgi:hypothetical protein
VYQDIEGFKLTSGSKTALVQRLIVAVEQRRVSWPAGREGVMQCDADRAAQITRDTGLAAALSRDAAYTSTAAPTPPCGQASLTHSRAGASPDPIRATFHPSHQGAMAGISTSGADWQVLTNEMKRYEYEILPSGTITYSAPAGYHDDCVMALALANHRRWETESVGRMLPVAGSVRRQGVRARRRERVLIG